jgi:hypothetical protein
LDVGQLQLFGHNLGQLVERDVDLELVLAVALAGLALSVAGLPSSPAQWVTGLTLALTHAALPSAEPCLKRGTSMKGTGSGPEVLSLLAEHLALLHVLCAGSV